MYNWNDNNSGGNWQSSGLFVSADGSRLYGMFKRDIKRIDGDIPLANVALISGLPESNGVPVFAVGTTHIVFCTPIDVTSVITSTDTEDAFNKGSYNLKGGVLDVAYVDGRFVYIRRNGESVYWSEIDDPMNVDELSFFDSESRPDSNKALGVIGNDLYVLGDKSIERFRNTGPTTAPFVRVTNSVLAVGYVGGKINLSDRIVFIGRAVGGGRGIYELSGSTFNKISSPAVDELLNIELAAGLTNEKIELCYSQSWDSYGRTIYSFAFREEDGTPPTGTTETHISDLTLYAVNNGEGYQWGFLSDNPVNGHANYREWGIQNFDISTSTGVGVDFRRGFNFVAHTFFDGDWYAQRATGSEDSGIFIKTSSESDENQSVDESENIEPITRGFRSFLRNDEEKDMTLATLEIVYSKQGVYRQSSNSNPTGGDADDKITLRVSETAVGWGYGILNETEGRDWSDPGEISFGDLGDSGRALFQSGGAILDAQRGYIGMVVESDADIPLTIEKVIYT